MRVLALTVAAGLLCTGCANAPITVQGAILTSGASMAQGKRAEVSHFTPSDYVIQLVDFSWPDMDKYGGTHAVTWNWYHDGLRVSTGAANHMRFVHPPFTLRTTRAAATLGTGHFSVETVVDDNVVATSHFDIAP